MKLRRWAPLLVAGLLPLSACGELTPGTAAVVDGVRISRQQVDDLAQAQCDAADASAQPGGSSALPISRVRQQSLGLLMDTALSKQYAAEKGITADQKVADGIYAQFAAEIEKVPASARATLAQDFKDWTLGRAAMVAVGSEETGEAASQANLEKLMTTGLNIREKWLPTVQVDTDARYAPAKNGFPGAGDGSVSKATSSFAKDTVAQQPDPAWVGSLPADQKCG